MADARVEAAQTRLAAAQAAQADAERALLDAQAQAAAAGDADAAAMDRQVAAATRLRAAEAETATATRELGDAQTMQARTAEAAAAKIDTAEAATTKATAASTDAKTGFLGMSAGMSTVALGSAAVAAGVGLVGGAAVKMAGDFQDSTTHLVTDAGETQANLAMVQAGILRIAASTGTSASALSDAMYHIESAGFHGAQGLQLLQTAAQGAKVGGADFDTVAKTLTGTMNSYNLTGDQAVTMMNQLIATVGAGDMRMQDLAASLGNVTPVAAAAHLSFAEVGGALATMTSQNMSAQQATQDLANTIRSLQSPNNVAIQEMQELGLSSNDVSQQLGQRGLTGTLELLTKAVAAHTQGGQVLIDTFEASKQAANDANQMIAAMPPNLAKLAQGYLDGSVNSKEWRKDLQGLDPIQAHMMTQFAGLADKTHQFNHLLTSGNPAAQTYNAALEKMLGGATGLNTALMLTGDRMGAFRGNVTTVADAARKGGDAVDNWGTIQATFNQKMDVAKQSLSAAAIAIGTALLPAVSNIVGGITAVLGPLSQWIAEHSTLSAIIFTSVGVLGGLVATSLVAVKTFGAVKTAVGGVRDALGFVAKAFVTTAGTSEGAAAASLRPWVANTGKMIASAAVTAAGWVSAAASTAVAWVAAGARMLAQTVVWVAQNTAKIAVIVAENVAGAAISAAAWIAANAVMLLGIGLIVTAVIAAVVFIVTHWKQIAEFFTGLWKDIVAVAQTAWKDFTSFLATAWSDITSTAETIWNALKSFFAQWWPLLLGIFTGGVGLIVGLIIKFHTQISDAIHTAWNAIRDFLTGLWNDVASIARSVWNGIVGFFQGIWAWITGLFRSAGDAVRGTWNDVMHWFEGIPGWIGSIFGDAGNWLLNAGRDIISGLWNGIQSAVGWLLGQVRNIGNNIVGAFKNALNIFSPSQVMADEVGRYIPLGIAHGITANMGAVAAAARLATQQAVTGGQVGLSVTGEVGLPSLIAGSGGTQIMLDLRGAQVMNERDMDNLVDKIGRALATRILPSGGVRLAF